jgi:hypothetical protein
LPIRKLIPIVILQSALLFGQAKPPRPRQQQTQQGSELDASPALFAVMAAINISGYDADVDSPANHPLRQQIRQYLLAKNLPVAEDLRAFYRNHRQKDAAAELSQYVSFALSVEDPPSFQSRFKPNELPPDVAEMQGFDVLMQRFYKEANIDELWQRAQPVIEQALEKYHTPVVQAVNEVNAYLRNSASSPKDRRFQIYLDLLGAPNQIQTRSYAGDYFVVLTPSPEPQTNDVRHVYLHYLLDPLAMRNAEALEKKKAIGEFAIPAPLLAQYYKNDFVLLTGACAVRAVEARLAAPSKRPQMIDDAMKEGFILTAAIADELPQYEKQEQSMRLYFAEIVKGIDLKKEDRRLAGIQFTVDRAVRMAKPTQRAPEPEPTGAEKALNEAEDYYRARNLDKAKESYLRILEQGADKDAHAKAYYGLARIAAIQRDPETAEKLFQKSLELGGDPQVKAWCHVYLARLGEAAAKAADQAGHPEEAAKERGQATEHYQAALGVAGASDAAKQAAQQGLTAARKR